MNNRTSLEGHGRFFCPTILLELRSPLSAALHFSLCTNLHGTEICGVMDQVGWAIEKNEPLLVPREGVSV